MVIPFNSPDTSQLDKLGYIPFVGTVSGSGRIVYGVAKTIFSAFAVLFSIVWNNSPGKWADHCGDGLLHIGRGFVEIMPIIGGLCTYSWDMDNLRSEGQKHPLWVLQQ